jgi:hypothetical protein
MQQMVILVAQRLAERVAMAVPGPWAAVVVQAELEALVVKGPTIRALMVVENLGVPE